MKKNLIISTLLTIAALVGIILLIRKGITTESVANGSSNVSMVDGKQVIRIDAKGGYAPRMTIAHANVPTTLLVKTNGTFDCSSGVSIPSLGFRTTLPSSGDTPIEIPPQSAGKTITAVCSMGMYNFTVSFR